MAGRILTPAQQKLAFELMGDPKDFNADAVVALFAYTKKGNGIRFYPEDVITIGPAESPFVKPNSKTTLGMYIVNKFLYEDLGVLGYVNKQIDGKLNGKVDQLLADALKEGDITHEQFCNYIDRSQYLYGGPLAFIINTSLTSTVMSLPPAAKKQRAELLKEHKAELEANDPNASSKIEKAVVTTALSEMRKKNDPAMALFDSGCGVDPYNNYRTMFVMKGSVQDNTGESPTGYKVVVSNYDEGISKEDVPKIADSVVTTAYSSGVATQDSGTNAKKYNAYFQRIRIQPRGSDCGSKETLTVNLTDGNASDYIYRYMKEGSKLVMLTPDNVKQYIGKTIQIRSGIYCKAKDPEYCSICVGDRPYRIGIRNIGLTFNIVSGSTLNASLKKKHDVSIKLYDVTVDDVMKYVH